MRHGRRRPYTEIGLRRVACVRCGEPASQQWSVCADGLWRPICTRCDIALNAMVLRWMNDPKASAKMKRYRENPTTP